MRNKQDPTTIFKGLYGKLTKAMGKTVLPVDVTVYRSLDLAQIGLSQELLSSDEDLVGREVTDLAFMSTSLDIDAAKKFNSHDSFMIIHARAGQQGTYMEELTTNKEEYEILFPPGSKLRIMRVWQEDEKWNFEAELL